MAAETAVPQVLTSAMSAKPAEQVSPSSAKSTPHPAPLPPVPMPECPRLPANLLRPDQAGLHPGLPPGHPFAMYAQMGHQFGPPPGNPAMFLKSPEGMHFPGAPPFPGMPFDPNFGPMYPYDRFGNTLDMRRKNATRETTAALKAWLYEHRKNPYPTKGEKIMLAIISKMTLTQVSTWFANARRRLKKEGKITWSPRNQSGNGNDSGSEVGDDDVDMSLRSPTPEMIHQNGSCNSDLPDGQASVPPSHDSAEPEAKKPKIWSIEDTLNLKTTTSPTKTEPSPTPASSAAHPPRPEPTVTQAPAYAFLQPWANPMLRSPFAMPPGFPSGPMFAANPHMAMSPFGSFPPLGLLPSLPGGMSDLRPPVLNLSTNGQLHSGSSGGSQQQQQLTPPKDNTPTSQTG